VEAGAKTAAKGVMAVSLAVEGARNAQPTRQARSYLLRTRLGTLTMIAVQSRSTAKKMQLRVLHMWTSCLGMHSRRSRCRCLTSHKRGLSVPGRQ